MKPIHWILIAAALIAAAYFIFFMPAEESTEEDIPTYAGANGQDITLVPEDTFTPDISPVLPGLPVITATPIQEVKDPGNIGAGVYTLPQA